MREGRAHDRCGEKGTKPQAASTRGNRKTTTMRKYDSPPTLPKLVANRLGAVCSIHTPHPASFVQSFVLPSAHHLFFVPLLILLAALFVVPWLALLAEDETCMCVDEEWKWEECEVEELLWLGECPAPHNRAGGEVADRREPRAARAPPLRTERHVKRRGPRGWIGRGVDPI